MFVRISIYAYIDLIFNKIGSFILYIIKLSRANKLLLIYLRNVYNFISYVKIVRRYLFN